jgi:hypothetical protein
VGSLCCVGALRPQALAANHHLVDSPGRREDPRSSGWARRSLRRRPSPGLGSYPRNPAVLWCCPVRDRASVPFHGLSSRMTLHLRRRDRAGAEPNPGDTVLFHYSGRAALRAAQSVGRGRCCNLYVSQFTQQLPSTRPKIRPKKSLPTSSGCTPAAPKARPPLSITRSEVTKSSSAIGQERIPVLFSIQPGLIQAVLRSSRCWCRFVVWRNRGLPLSS